MPRCPRSPLRYALGRGNRRSRVTVVRSITSCEVESIENVRFEFILCMLSVLLQHIETDEDSKFINAATFSAF